MSETLFRFLLGELTSLRARCKKPGCGGVVELPLASLVGRNTSIRCPLCDDPLQEHVPNNHLANLARAMEALAAAGNADVEFTLPLRDAKP